MVMEPEIETAQSADCVGHANGAAEAGNYTLLKYSDDVGNGNHDPGHDRVGKGPKNHKNVIDILDLAVPRPKVRPIDMLLDRYDWSSTAMMPLLQRDADGPSSRSDRPAPPIPPLTRTRSTRRLLKNRPTPPTKSRAPPPPPTPPTRPPNFLDLADRRRRPARKTLWKRARELVRNCFVRDSAAGPWTVGFWSR